MGRPEAERAGASESNALQNPRHLRNLRSDPLRIPYFLHALCVLCGESYRAIWDQSPLPGLALPVVLCILRNASCVTPGTLSNTAALSAEINFAIARRKKPICGRRFGIARSCSFSQNDALEKLR